MSERTFSLQPGVRERVPMFVGIVGPSGGGKTYSALRLATGMKKVHEGPIILIDTENRRGLHYADDFDFMHLPFGAPFRSLDYLAALREAERHNPSVIIIDSMSHEHEGPGGLLEAHEKELDRIAGDNQQRRHAMGFQAWQKPKAERRAFLQGMMRSDANIIACFRAQEKTKLMKNEKSKMEPTPIGWSAITDPIFVYEMAFCALLLPGSKGVPNWKPDMPAEQAFVKRPGQFENLFRDGEALSEHHGETIAKWAAGGSADRSQTESIDLDALIAEGSEAANLGMSFLAAFWKRQPKKVQVLLETIKEETWKPRATRSDKAADPDEAEDRSL